MWFQKIIPLLLVSLPLSHYPSQKMQADETTFLFF